jgi:hypothetical protein
MSPSPFPSLADRIRRYREILLWVLGGVAGLILVLSWIGYSHSGPVRVVERAARERLSRPDLIIENAVVLPSGRDRLVCGWIAGDPARPVAAEVRVPRILATPDRFGRYSIRILSVPGSRAPTHREAALQRRCENSPLRRLAQEIP